MAHRILSIARKTVKATVRMAYSKGRSILLQGPPGVGKSYTLREVAHELGRNAYVVHSHGDILAGEITFSYAPIEGKWMLNPGPVMLAMGYSVDPATGTVIEIDPGIVIFDDIHEMGPGGLSALYMALDSAKSGADLTLPGGQRITPKPGYGVGLTMNGVSSELPAPVCDRLFAVCPVMQPSDAMLEELNEHVRALCELDYDGKTIDPVGTYRQWSALSDLMDTPDVSLYDAVVLAFHGDADKVNRVLMTLEAAEHPDAPAALATYLENLRDAA